VTDQGTTRVWPMRTPLAGCWDQCWICARAPFAQAADFIVCERCSKILVAVVEWDRKVRSSEKDKAA
jgi:hypothetical protein